MKIKNDVINVTVIRLRLIFTVYVGHNDDIYVDDQNIRKHKSSEIHSTRIMRSGSREPYVDIRHYSDKHEVSKQLKRSKN